MISTMESGVPTKPPVSKTVRLVFHKPTYYSNKVLVGPWVNDRLNVAYVPPVYHNTTTYHAHYPPKPISRLDQHTLMWDQKLNAEESNFIPQTARADFPNYFENFSSTYDLAFHHFPKCLRPYEPAREYISSYGNLTKYGLGDHKKEEWQCEVEDPRRNKSTHYNDTYKAPSESDYERKRFATPRANSSILDGSNLLALALNLRDTPVSNVRPPFELVTVPRTSHFNPITWECIPEMPVTECSNKKCT